MVNFNFSYAPGTSLQQMVGFETAGRVWASLLTDNVTVNIYASVSSLLPSNAIGGALPGIRAHQSYSAVVSGLVNDATSADDTTAISFLDRNIYSARFDNTNSSASVTTDNINVTSANAKAIGLLGASTALDGVILFGGLQGSGYSWNYDYARSGSASANSLDFLSTAIHEIGHVLGFVSGVDKPGWISQMDFSSPTAPLDYLANLSDRITYATPLDLFRYSNTAGYINDLSYGSNGGRSNKFFSLDKGMTSIASFSTGANKALGGDGSQASHWKDATPGILDPSLAGGERLSISRTDLRAFDAIGWNLKSTTGSLNLDLSALKSQSDQALAQRLGTTVASLYANAGMSALGLSSIQLAAVNAMIQDSQVYDWGKKPPSNPTPPSPVSQVIELMQSQTVYANLETLDDEVVSTGRSAPSVNDTIKSSQAQSQFTKLLVSLPTLDWGIKPPVSPTPPTPVSQVIDLNYLTQFTKLLVSLPTLDWGSKPPVRPTPPTPVSQVIDLNLTQVVQPTTSVSNSSNSPSASRKFDLLQDSIALTTSDLLAL